MGVNLRRSLALCLCSLWMGWAQPMVLPETSIGLDTTQGQELLLQSQARADYWPLSIHYETQQGPAECGPASCVMVLNSLGLEAPPHGVHKPFHQFTQDNFFSPEVEKVLPRSTLLQQGATLDELGGMLRAWNLKVEICHAQDTDLETFRRQASEALASGEKFVIFNYHRDPLQQVGGSHFSPLAAYHQGSDRFLVLDVARFRYVPYWVSARSVFEAMNTVDGVSRKSRGYLLISR